ncbi:MAG: GGDEF domain-containing protein [Lachnospiraceae bacterium]|nr:GGDEF domain-containing protein [Lachnospiraceae bacterium]
MTKRKRIAAFVAYPELIHVRRILDGIREQCKTYDYDLCVFSSNTHLSFPHEEYVQGEGNIFELANFDALDGVILDYSTLTGDPGDKMLKRLRERLANYPDLPKCILEVPLEGLHLIENDNEAVLREMCRHVIEVHGCKNICILTGNQGFEVAEKRLAIFLDEIGKHGLEVTPEHVVYGDFWYFGGDALARKIASGEISRPDAVICASDCMAIGLMDRLAKYHIKVPGDIVVIGFDATDEGAVNPTPLSSFDPGDVKMGADAVDYLRSQIEPEKEIIPMEGNVMQSFHPGASCGCQTDPSYAMKRFRDALYVSSFNHADEDYMNKFSLGTLMESYALESFTASKSSEECLQNIFNYANLLSPFRNFYLCLKENWLDIEDTMMHGYPEEMKIYVANSAVEEGSYCGEANAVSFPTSIMLPKLEEDREEAHAFYFSPVHFNGILLGFAVLQRELVEHPALHTIYRNWLRYVNNALEMIRSKERLQTLSVRDEMTGAYNRRGMYEIFRDMLAKAKQGDSLFASVIDMDGLKYVNDTFGHGEGDLGIKTVCQVLFSIAKENEIIVRSGGDEFFLIGIGSYTKDAEAIRANEFTQAMAKWSERLEKPYNVSASIGCVVFEDCHKVSLDNALSEADERMYHYKLRHRRHRSV